MCLSTKRSADSLATKASTTTMALPAAPFALLDATRTSTNLAFPTFSKDVVVNTKPLARPRVEVAVSDDDDEDELCVPSTNESRRKRMRLKLEERLVRTQQGQDKESVQNKDKIKLQAILIEALLFNQSKETGAISDEDDDDEEEDESMMNRKLSLLVSRVQKKHNDRRKTSLNVTSPEAYRTMVLRQTMGETLFDQAKAIVRRIHGVGLTLAGRLTSGQMPLPVRRLFFETTLWTAWHHGPVSQLSTQPWSTMIAQAELHLAQYEAWMSTTQAVVA